MDPPVADGLAVRRGRSPHRPGPSPVFQAEPGPASHYTRPGSAAATALSNPDLLFELFEHLAPFPQLDIVQLGEIPSEHFKYYYSSETYLRKKTLANAALTCRDFAEPASSVLWRVLYPGLHPLFYPFPGFHKTKGLLKTREIDEFFELSPISNHVGIQGQQSYEWEADVFYLRIGP